MPLHPLWFAPFVALLVSGVVLADATRRGRTPRARALWTVGTGLLSVGGFVGVFLFRSYLFRAYPRLGGEPLVVRAPSHRLSVLFAGGLGVSVAALLAYGFGSRFGPLGTQPRSR